MTITRRTNRCDLALALIDKCLNEYEQMLAASHIHSGTDWAHAKHINLN